MSISITNPDKSEYWSIVDGGGVIIDSGRMGPELFLHTQYPQIVHDPVENAYLDDLNTVGTVSTPLPATGTELKAEEMYAWSGQNVIVRQDHIRTEHDPDTVPALFTVYREDYDGMLWIPNESVMIGDERSYETINYVCIQSHTTQVDWTPPVVPTLWSVVPDEIGEWQVGVAYVIDDEVIYLEIAYICIQSHTSQVTWEPPNVPTLWAVVT
jgi:hypothetical protein